MQKVRKITVYTRPDSKEAVPELLFEAKLDREVGLRTQCLVIWVRKASQRAGHRSSEQPAKYFVV